MRVQQTIDTFRSIRAAGARQVIGTLQQHPAPRRSEPMNCCATWKARWGTETMDSITVRSVVIEFCFLKRADTTAFTRPRAL